MSVFTSSNECQALACLREEIMKVEADASSTCSRNAMSGFYFSSRAHLKVMRSFKCNLLNIFFFLSMANSKQIKTLDEIW